MRKTVLNYLLLPLFTALPLALNAAPASVSEPATMSAITQVQGPSQSQSGKIDLNDADALTLQQNLQGIGVTKAEAIIAYRDANGPFHSVDELLEIKGIGKALLDRNREKLVVK